MYWSIVLAGGEGHRLQNLTRQLYSDGRPKQFCALDGGTRTMLERTLDRVALFAPAPRTVVSVCAHQEAWAADAMHRGHGWNIQPSSAGTGIAALMAALEIDARDPDAIAAIFPSDHYVSDDFRFMAYVHQAAVWVEHNRDDLLLLGIRPSSPAPDLGWLQPRQPAPGWSGPEPIRLIEKPSTAEAALLVNGGALWNTAVAVGRVGLLLRLFEVMAPHPWRALSAARGAGGAAVEQAFAALEPLDLSHHVFAHATQHLRGLLINGVVWSDWGTEERIRSTLVAERPEPADADSTSAGAGMGNH